MPAIERLSRHRREGCSADRGSFTAEPDRRTKDSKIWKPKQRFGENMLNAFMGRLASPWNADVHVERPRKLAGRCPLVSVVVPCYNYGHYLPDCVKSVLDQEDVRVDVLIIDDASPDGSAEVASRLAAQDIRVRTIRHDTNKGHIATYNEGLAQARGDYAVLLSADDLMTPGCLSRATALMEAHPSVGLTYGFTVDFVSSQPPPARTRATSWIAWQGHSWFARICQTGRNLLRSPEAVMRTTVLHQIGGYRADLPHVQISRCGCVQLPCPTSAS